MKTFLIFIIPLCIVAIGLSAHAFIYGVEPPAKYMNNLRTCTPTNITTADALVIKYIIKGKLPDGRCQVTISAYTNFANPKVYNGYKDVVKAFSNNKIKDSDIPTQVQMIEQGKKEKMVGICKFTSEQRNALYHAYLKHDAKGKNISSYESLMQQYVWGEHCKIIQ